MATGQYNNTLTQWLGVHGLTIRNEDGSEGTLPAVAPAITMAASTAASTATDPMPSLPDLTTYGSQELDELAFD